MDQKIAAAGREIRTVLDNINRVIIGKEEQARLLLLAFLCRGHVLIDDIPGVGKTMLARAFAVSLGGDFRRIQCTPDLLPSDLLGVSIYNPETRRFHFHKGPVFTQFLLVDEINRATPRTQSALLECMGENQVTVDGHTMPVPDPFMVIGTQNPVEFEGTFPLPEAQMDRFFLSLELGYPQPEEELAVIEGQRLAHPIDSLQRVVDPAGFVTLRDLLKGIHIDTDLRRYLLELVTATRRDPRILLGASPRGSLALFRGAQAMALASGRDYVIPDDIKSIAGPVLTHRVIIRSEARMKGYTPGKIIAELVHGQEVPIEDGDAKE